MRPLLLILMLSFAAPATAENTENEPGLSLMERGAQMLLEGMMRELEPALENLQDMGPALRGFVVEMGPALADVLDRVKDWSAYHPPEVLPNGDIIIRRKDTHPVVPDEDGQIDI